MWHKLSLHLAIVILLLAGNTFAEDLICFDKAQANVLLKDVQEKNVLLEENKALQDKISFMKQENELLVQKSKILLDMTKTQEQVIHNFDDMLKKQKQVCEEEIRKAKPSFFDKLKDTGFGIVLGIIGATILIAL